MSEWESVLTPQWVEGLSTEDSIKAISTDIRDFVDCVWMVVKKEEWICVMDMVNDFPDSLFDESLSTHIARGPQLTNFYSH